jgi:hypothetical protein
MRVPEPNRETGAVHLGFQIENAEHLHPVRRNGVLVVHDADVSEAERLDESLNDLVMWNRAVGGGCCWCGDQGELFTRKSSALVPD